MAAQQTLTLLGIG